MECITLPPFLPKKKSVLCPQCLRESGPLTVGKNVEPESNVPVTSFPAILVENGFLTIIPETHPVPSSFLSPAHADLQGCGCLSVSPLCNPPSAICQFTASAISTANPASECQARTWSNCCSRFLLTQMLTFCWHNLQ